LNHTAEILKKNLKAGIPIVMTNHEKLARNYN
jgi:hypothetical protein